MAGAVDEDTRRAIAGGRQTLGAMLATAQQHLQKVFIVFVIVFLGTFYLLQEFVWSRLKADLFRRMGPLVREGTSVVATTPFDVILLQVKIGLVVGVLLSIPPLLYYSRDPLRARGFWPHLPRWKIALLGALGVVLFLGGIVYSYELFFPLMFEFLASNALQTGIRPTYSIVMWAQFVFLLTLSFGLAAQLPLIMSGLAYAEIVPYETFRSKWKYAVLGIFVVGALLSPPDPFTQLLWAAPLVVLYAFSLKFTKLIVGVKYGSQRLDVGRTIAENRSRLLGAAVLGAAVVYGAVLAGRQAPLSEPIAFPLVPYAFEIPTGQVISAFGISTRVGVALLAVLAAVLAFAFALAYALYASVDFTTVGHRSAGGTATGSSGDPAAIDVADLDTAGVQAAPDEAFETMSEDEALAIAREAMEAGDADRAQAVLDRFDATQAVVEDEPETESGDESAEEWLNEWEPATGTDADRSVEASAVTGVSAPENHSETSGPSTNSEGAEEGSAVTRTTAGMVDAFTDEETTEEDIGGYYYDITFVLESLTSKAFRIVAVFMTVLAATFYFLYQGGVGQLKADFLSRLPPAIAPDGVDVVALHPVEVLVFDVKISTLAAALATLPLVLYYAWPALKERGFAGGDRRILLVWALTLLAGVVVGSLVGYAFVAPQVISWLAADAVRANMVIAYRISAAGWLVFFTTAGVGLLASVPLTMVLFHRGGIVSYARMYEHWRGVTIAVLAIVAYTTPQGVFMMFIIGIPTMLSYFLGLGFLWLFTLGGRRTPESRDQRESAD